MCVGKPEHPEETGANHYTTVLPTVVIHSILMLYLVSLK